MYFNNHFRMLNCVALCTIEIHNKKSGAFPVLISNSNFSFYFIMDYRQRQYKSKFQRKVYQMRD